MSTQIIILLSFIFYTLLLFGVMWLTSRRSSGNDAFFRAGRRSPWPVVAYGMLGASLSGVTFMSVPGGVYYGQFTYMPLVFGYVIGYFVIAFLLLPLYYRLNLTSIYTYLDQRMGPVSERTGSLFFILSRLLGSALRMYLVVFVLYELVFRAWGIPFWLPAVAFIAIILLYTFRGGLKTVVWTDTLQTTFLLLAALATVVVILKNLDMSIPQLLVASSDEGYTRIFETDPNHPKYYWKQIVSGAFITIAMTGLDQDMMQKNLTCKSLRDAQKNVITSSFLFIIVNLIFLTLGAALVYYGTHTPGFEMPVGADGKVLADKIYPAIAQSIGGFTLICFVLGMVAAGYSSADGTLTALTTTLCYDFLHFDKRQNLSQQQQVRYRKMVHVGFALLYLLVIIAFRPFHNDSLINILFDVAGYTYGPLLGMYAFGLFTKRTVRDRLVPVVAIASPVVCYLLKLYSSHLFGGYQLGFELLLINGLLTFLGLLAISVKDKQGGHLLSASGKRGGITTAILAVALLPLCSSCSNYKVFSMRDNPTLPVDGGVLYALPSTRICLSVTVVRRDLSNAPYCDFAVEMLGLSPADTDTSFRIADIGVATSNVADPDNYYMVKIRRGSLAVDHRHLLLAIGTDAPLVGDASIVGDASERRIKSGAASQPHPSTNASYNLYDRTDTLYSRYDAPGHPSYVSSRRDSRSLKQRALAAAQRLDEIQTKRQELLGGEYDGSYSQEAIAFLNSQLQQQEAEIVALFCGTLRSETVTYFIEPSFRRRVEAIDTLAWFSPSEGLMGFVDATSSADATPIICCVSPSGDMRSANRFVKYHTSGVTPDGKSGRTGNAYSRRRSSHDFRYRLPEAATLEVSAGPLALKQQVLLSQLGPVMFVPRRKVKALFNPVTLDLMSLSVGR